MFRQYKKRAPIKWKELNHHQRAELHDRKRENLLNGRFNKGRAPLGYVYKMDKWGYRSLVPHEVMRRGIEAAYYELVDGRRINSAKDAACFLTERLGMKISPSKAKRLLSDPINIGWIKVPRSYDPTIGYVKGVNITPLIDAGLFKWAREVMKEQGWCHG